MITKRKRKPLSKEHKDKISGKNNGRWKGGRNVSNEKGYFLLKRPDHPFANGRGYVLEHRLAMEDHLGRTLLPTEIVHHINGDTGDNRIENLMLFSGHSEHAGYHDVFGKYRAERRRNDQAKK